MNLTDFYDILNHHDWFYSYSDDHKVYIRGRNNETKLMIMAGEYGKEYKDLYDAFHYYYFTERIWSEETFPKRPSNAQIKSQVFTCCRKYD